MNKIQQVKSKFDKFNPQTSEFLSKFSLKHLHDTINLQLEKSYQIYSIRQTITKSNFSKTTRASDGKNGGWANPIQ